MFIDLYDRPAPHLESYKMPSRLKVVFTVYVIVILFPSYIFLCTANSVAILLLYIEHISREVIDVLLLSERRHLIATSTIFSGIMTCK